MSSLYPKIYSPWKRVVVEGKEVFDPNLWQMAEFGLLADLFWHWTEKIDGMNIRIVYDGYERHIAGRTDKAMFKTHWTEFLERLFPVEILEETFGTNTAVIYGELYGAGIQSGTPYGKLPLSFTMFDVKVGDWWLLPDNVRDIAKKLDIYSPVEYNASLWTAIKHVKEGVKSDLGDFTAEGLVGRAPAGLQTRSGHRLMMKVKDCDFRVPEVSVSTAPLA